MEQLSPSPNESPPTYTTAYAALHQPLGSPLSILGRVNKIFDPEGPPVQLRRGEDLDGVDDSPVRAHFRLRFQDHGGTAAIQTLPTDQIELVQLASDALKGGQRVLITGRYVQGDKPVRGASGRPLFFDLQRIDFVRLPSDLLGISASEAAHADATLDRFTAPGQGPDALSQHMIGTLRRRFHVATQNFSERQYALERLTLLQALSFGQVNPIVNPRISTYFVSDSATGKKIFANYALTLAPVSSHVEPHLWTKAGLTAVVRQNESCWTAEAGALPEADGGVFVLEDSHRIEGKDVNFVQGAFLTTMEDGKVAPTKAARATFSARAALHLNGNWRSGLQAGARGRGAAERILDVPLLSMDVLSRCDVVAIMDDEQDPAPGAREIATQPAHQADPAQEAADRATDRELRVLVARLIDRIPSVDLTPVEGPLGQLMDDVTLVVREYTARLSGPQRRTLNPDGLLRRMANTLRKLVGAAARLRGSSVASEADVEVAGEMLQFKLEIVQWICGEATEVQKLGRLAVQVERARRMRDQRFALVLERFGGRSGVRLSDIAEELGFSERWLRWELLRRGIEPAGPLGYKIPTWVEWTIEQARVEAYRNLGLGAPPRLVADEVEVDEEGNPLWMDVLPGLPGRWAPVLWGLKNIHPEQWECDQQAINLINLALGRKDADFAGAWHYKLAERGYYDSDTLDRALVDEVIAALEDGRDPVARSILALTIYVESGLPNMDLIIKNELKEQGDKVPEEVQAAARAVLRRLAWYDKHTARG